MKIIKELPEESKLKLLKAGFSEENSVNENVEGIDSSKFSNSRYFSAITGHFILTPLAYAAREGDLNLVKDLVKNGADLNLRDNAGHTPLMSAARYGRHPIVKYLLQSGADSTLTSTGLYAGATAYDLTKCSLFSPSSFWFAAQKCLGTGDIDKTRALLCEAQHDNPGVSMKKFQ